MPDHQQRPPDRTVTEYEDQKGEKPRPATEPSGSTGASRTDKTQTDPATGEDKGGAKGSEKV